MDKANAAWLAGQVTITWLDKDGKAVKPEEAETALVRAVSDGESQEYRIPVAEIDAALNELFAQEETEVKKAALLDSGQTHLWAPIVKVDAEQRMVYGKVADDALDLDQQIADRDWLKGALPAWFDRWANIREMHQPKAVGVGKELEPLGDGFFLASKIVDQDAWAKVEEGVYKGYSIGIKGPKIKADVKAAKGRIVGGQIVEVSLVDHPSNEGCRFVLAKMAGGQLVEAAEKVHIPSKEGEPKSPPKGYPTDPDLYADPKNYSWPIDSKKRALAAMVYYNAGRGEEKYSEEEWGTIGRRIAQAAEKFFGVPYVYRDGELLREQKGEKAASPEIDILNALADFYDALRAFLLRGEEEEEQEPPAELGEAEEGAPGASGEPAAGPAPSGAGLPSEAGTGYRFGVPWEKAAAAFESHASACPGEDPEAYIQAFPGAELGKVSRREALRMLHDVLASLYPEICNLQADRPRGEAGTGFAEEEGTKEDHTHSQPSPGPEAASEGELGAEAQPQDITDERLREAVKSALPSMIEALLPKPAAGGPEAGAQAQALTARVEELAGQVAEVAAQSATQALSLEGQLNKVAQAASGLAELSAKVAHLDGRIGELVPKVATKDEVSILGGRVEDLEKRALPGGPYVGPARLTDKTFAVNETMDAQAAALQLQAYEDMARNHENPTVREGARRLAAKMRQAMGRNP